MYGYIYKTTNLINGHLYIGQHLGTFDSSYLGSGIILSKAIKKYGRDNFRLEVIAFASNDKMLDGLEMKYIYEYRQVFGKKFLYNITDGGGGVKGHRWKNAPRSPEACKNLSNAKKKLFAEGKLKSWNEGKKLSEDTKRKIGLKSIGRKTFLGKKHSPEAKIKIRQYRLGKKASEQLKEKLSRMRIGRKHSDESILKMKELKRLWWVNKKGLLNENSII